jgi:hypothetical protein
MKHEIRTIDGVRLYSHDTMEDVLKQLNGQDPKDLIICTFVDETMIKTHKPKEFRNWIKKNGFQLK